MSHEPGPVGVLLPNVSGAPVTLLALWSLGKVPALLNYSTGTDSMPACAQLAGLKQIITSRAFVERAKLNLAPLVDAGTELIYLEDVHEQISGAQKLAALLGVAFNPSATFRQLASATDTAAILFTSGSEGVPKGVELTHHNLLANIRQMLAITDIQDWDRLFNPLPHLYSFG